MLELSFCYFRLFLTAALILVFQAVGLLFFFFKSPLVTRSNDWTLRSWLNSLWHLGSWLKHQSQKSLLANDSIENIVDKEHIQQEPASILRRAMEDQQKRANRLQNKFNWVNTIKILLKLVRQVEYFFKGRTLTISYKLAI